MSRSRRLLGAGLVLAAALLLTGCVRGRGAAQTLATQANTTANAPPGRLKRTIDKPKVMGYQHNIGQMYTAYITDKGKPPAKADDFLEYIKPDAPQEYRVLKDGYLVLNVKAGTDANQVLCYEKDADLDGNRIVAMGDGSVHTLSTADFDKALPPKDR
jgi:hypothetical protein